MRGPGQTKNNAMFIWLIPTSLKQLRGILGLTGFYRRFIKNHASISFNLIELLKKESLKWDSNAQKSFEDLKLAMTKAPVLALSDFSQQFIIQTDASKFGTGAVLTQNGHLICHLSKILSKIIKFFDVYSGTSCSNDGYTKMATLLTR